MPPDQSRKQQPSVCVCVRVGVYLSSCSVSIVPVQVGWVGRVVVVHTAWLKNSSTTPGAMFGVWDDVLQTQPLSSQNTPPTHTNTSSSRTRMHINMLTVCIHPANMLVTHKDRHFFFFLTGVKIAESRGCYEKLKFDLLWMQSTKLKALGVFSLWL